MLGISSIYPGKYLSGVPIVPQALVRSWSVPNVNLRSGIEARTQHTSKRRVRVRTRVFYPGIPTYVPYLAYPPTNVLSPVTKISSKILRYMYATSIFLPQPNSGTSHPPLCCGSSLWRERFLRGPCDVGSVATVARRPLWREGSLRESCVGDWYRLTSIDGFMKIIPRNTTRENYIVSSVALALLHTSSTDPPTTRAIARPTQPQPQTQTQAHKTQRKHPPNESTVFRCGLWIHPNPTTIQPPIRSPTPPPPHPPPVLSRFQPNPTKPHATEPKAAGSVCGLLPFRRVLR